MSYVEYLPIYQLDNTSLAQAMLHVVQCVCKKISNYRKHTSAKHHQLKNTINFGV